MTNKFFPANTATTLLSPRKLILKMQIKLLPAHCVSPTADVRKEDSTEHEFLEMFHVCLL